MTPLEKAARAAGRAPSVFNTQPWRWRVSGDALELIADTGRRVESIDPDGRLLMISLGAALHHAVVALRAAGWSAPVTYFPADGVIASVRLGHPVPPAADDAAMATAIPLRRTDRRSFGEREVSENELTRLRETVERHGAYLHTVRPDQIALLAMSTELAGAAELAEPAYREDLDRWTHRSETDGDGVPAETAVHADLRRVPVRDFAPDSPRAMPSGAAHDQGAAYVVLFGNGDDSAALLHGGEALSALLLLATADGLATAPLSDAIEVEWPRHLLRGLLADVGEPYLVVRLGYAVTAMPLPPAPRRDPADVISRI